MTLIKSISGIRGTIGGTPGEGLSPMDNLEQIQLIPYAQNTSQNLINYAFYQMHSLTLLQNHLH